MMTGRRRTIPRLGPLGPLRAAGMTMIELILVMALLVVVLGLSVPVLSTFFAGRRSQEEARRLLALTLYARSEAVSQSAPMEVWLDPANGQYGARSVEQTEETAMDSPAAEEARPLEYRLADRLSLEVDPQLLDEQGLAKITFLPDGTSDENSVPSVGIREENDGERVLERQAVGTGYTLR